MDRIEYGRQVRIRKKDIFALDSLIFALMLRIQRCCL